MKLKKCACDLLKYCSVGCQKNHRSLHKKVCKRQLAKTRDDRLFTQPDGSCYGECPICCLPLSLDFKKWSINTCCCQRICSGCSHANQKREWKEGLDQKCPFCREPLPKTDEQQAKNYMKRAKANDPVALCNMGKKHYDNKGDHKKAFEYWTRATELGDAEAHFNLSILYQLVEGVEKDKKKEVYHLEEAAVGGHPDARYNLGCEENENGRVGRAVKHWIIAAKLGHDHALETVKECFWKGLAKKEDYETALRGHQAAVDATKSQQRDTAEEWSKKRNVH